MRREKRKKREKNPPAPRLRRAKKRKVAVSQMAAIDKSRAGSFVMRGNIPQLIYPLLWPYSEGKTK